MPEYNNNNLNIIEGHYTFQRGNDVFDLIAGIGNSEYLQHIAKC